MLKISENNLIATGFDADDIVMWSIVARVDEAKSNVMTALSVEKISCPIFLGIEHILPLIDTGTHQTCVIIEKSLEYKNLFCETFLAGREIPDTIIFITGENGFVSPALHLAVRAIYLRQEIGLLAYKLNQLPDNLFDGAVPYLDLAPGPLDALYHEQIMALADLLIAAKKFHWQHRIDYQACRLQQNQDNVLVFVDDISHQKDDTEKIFFFIRKPYKKYAYEMPVQFNQTQHDLLFPVTVSRAEDNLNLSTGDFGRMNAESLLTKLKELKPKFVTQTNRGFFWNLHDILYSEEMLKRLNVPLYTFYGDWFSHQTNRLRGGWSHDLTMEFFKAAPRKIFSNYPYNSALYGPAEGTSYYPSNFFITHDKITSAVTSPSELARDVAIVHVTRIYSIEWNEMNELYELIEANSTLPAGQALFRFLYHLRASVKAIPALNNFVVKNIVHYLEWIYYCQVRIRLVMRAVRELTKQGLSVAVYGKQWDKVLPPAVCAGLVDYEGLKNVYRLSGVVLDFSPTYCMQIPHFPALDCVAAGGLPIVAAPLLNRDKNITPLEFDARELTYFDSVTEAVATAAGFKTDFNKRNTEIARLQAKLKDSMRESNANIDDLSRTNLKQAVTPPGSFSGDADKDELLIAASTGYLLLYLGNLAEALSLWQHLIINENLSNVGLIKRAIKTAIELKNRESAHVLVTRATKDFPADTQIASLDQQVRSEFS